MNNLDDYLAAKENFNSSLLVGESGVGKSSQLALMAKNLYDLYGFKTLLLLADQGSGITPYVDMGLTSECGLKAYSIHDSKHPLSTLNKIGKGYWPEYIETEKGVEGVIREKENFKIDFNEYQILILDSLSGLATYLGEYFSNPAQSIGFKLGVAAKDDDYEFGSMAEGHYNLAHNELIKFMSMWIPRLPLHYFLVTAHIEQTKTSYCPATIGKALNNKIGSWFRNSFHMATEMVDVETIKKQKVEAEFGVTKETDEGQFFEARVGWFKEHRNELTNIPYKMKARIPLKISNLVQARYPKGYQILDTQLGLLRFFDYLKKAEEVVKNQKDNN